MGADKETARERAYHAYDKIRWQGKFCRRDIGTRESALSAEATAGAADGFE